MNRVVPVVFVQALPIPAFAQVGGEVDGDRYLGRVVVLGAVVELPALDPPALRRSARCRPRSRPFTPTLVAHTGLQLADAHPTLRGLAVGAVEANRSLVAQWAVRSPARAYTVKARVAAGTWWRAGVIACRSPRLMVAPSGSTNSVDRFETFAFVTATPS